MINANTDEALTKTLILNFFYNHVRALTEEGNVYIECPPLYRMKANKEQFYCFEESESVLSLLFFF